MLCDAPGLTQSFGLSPAGLWHVVHGAWQWHRQRTGLLTTNFAEAGAFVHSRAELAQPDLQQHFVVGKLLDHGRQTVWGHGFSCHLCLLQPHSRGQVQLRSADPLTLPAVDPNFLGDARDLAPMVQGVRSMRHILAQPALVRHGPRELPASAAAQTADWLRQTADTIYHPVGTCRMGPGPLDVVDSQLRVHGGRGCGWWTPPSFRASPVATPMPRPSWWQRRRRTWCLTPRSMSLLLRSAWRKARSAGWASSRRRRQAGES